MIRKLNENEMGKKRVRDIEFNIKSNEILFCNFIGSAKYGITEFADLTSTEYKRRTGLWQRDPLKAASTPKAEIPDVELPKEFDWRTKGAISKVGIFYFNLFID